MGMFGTSLRISQNRLGCLKTRRVHQLKGNLLGSSVEIQKSVGTHSKNLGKERVIKQLCVHAHKLSVITKVP